jgi:CheY-like chemotaxis protein
LLNNAAKYTERGGHISIVVDHEQTEVLVCVRDDGIGIDREMLPRIFEIFTQAKPAMPRSQGGLGIGLSLARGVTELHGGRIEVRSAGPGKGSEFVVRLPRLTGIGAGQATAVAEDITPAAARRVLVVDDLRDSADSLSVLLQTLGHDVRTVYGGEAAVQMAESFRPEAIFLDLGMPVVDGFEVCRRVRQQSWGQRVVIVAVSGWGQAEDRRRTAEAGFDHHLIKPADTATVVMLLTSLPTVAA